MSRWDWTPHSDLPWDWAGPRWRSATQRAEGVAWGASNRAVHRRRDQLPIGDLRHISHPPLEVGGWWGRAGWWGSDGEWVGLWDARRRRACARRS